MHLSPHFLSQKVENVPLWEVSAVLAAQGIMESTFLFHPNESFPLGSPVYIAFFWVPVSELPFSLNLQVSSLGLSCAPNFSQEDIRASF